MKGVFEALQILETKVGCFFLDALYLEEPLYLSDLDALFVCVHFNIVEWEKPVIVNPQELFWGWSCVKLSFF